MTGAECGNERGPVCHPAPRRDITAIPFADASPRMQAAARYLQLLAMLNPDVEVVECDEADIDAFYGTTPLPGNPP
jgi:hypothetical protein